ncbi:hypothetical protein HPP92_022775 [Vanilla planifolia]|uniref:Uncharacterized protein n=1 Tax=Vanilla planifolia TaxID=51239 RepID=A0A835PY47_VANPL|nr:hypothetical protein HPP92_022775 [Vanilla planifolia]
MADDLSANLDDGELWLPSEVIRAVGVRRHSHYHRREAALLGSYPVDLTAASDLAENLAALGLIDLRAEIPTVDTLRDFSPTLEFVGQGKPVSCVSPASDGFRAPVSGRIAFDGMISGGTARFSHVSRPFHTFQPIKIAAKQNDEFERERTRVLLRQRLQQSQRLNRFIPGYTTGSGRVRGGTGVFLPRVGDVDAKKKPLSVKGSGQSQQTTWNPMIKKQTTPFLPPPEAGLPQDWTY